MRRFVAIGGGEMRSQVKINEFVASIIDREKLVGRTKPYVLFFPQASHESKPYTNSFFKTYGKLKCKADVVLFEQGEMDREHILHKIVKADILYFGGGDLRYLLDRLDAMDLREAIVEAYNRGVVFAGNSAGAMCLYKNALSDYLIERGEGDDYVLVDGYNIIDETCVCHADEEKRKVKADSLDIPNIRLIPSDTAVYYEDEQAVMTIEEDKEGDSNVGL